MTDNNRITTALLFGGRSSEHEVSLTSAASVIKAIDRQRFELVPILINRDGRWYLVSDTAFLTKNKARLVGEQDYDCRQWPRVLLDYANGGRLYFPDDRNRQDARQPQAVFPILHGPYGEDGTVQALCKMAGLPCVGAGILASAVGLDKVIMKKLFTAAGLPQISYLALDRNDWSRHASAVIDRIDRQLVLPVFVKPANAGSSVGVRRVTHLDQLAKAIEYASRFDRKIVVEKAITARELECAVIGNEAPQASGVGEVLPCHEFYDYQAKYLEEGSKTVVPAEIPEALAQEIREIALAAFRAIDCSGLARVDFLWERATQKLYLNEINTMPGFTPISMYPQLWQATGISYTDLITQLIDLALANFGQQQCEISPGEEKPKEEEVVDYDDER